MLPHSSIQSSFISSVTALPLAAHTTLVRLYPQDRLSYGDSPIIPGSKKQRPPNSIIPSPSATPDVCCARTMSCEMVLACPFTSRGTSPSISILEMWSRPKHLPCDVTDRGGVRTAKQSFVVARTSRATCCGARL